MSDFTNNQALMEQYFAQYGAGQGGLPGNTTPPPPPPPAVNPNTGQPPGTVMNPNINTAPPATPPATPPAGNTGAAPVEDPTQSAKDLNASLINNPNLAPGTAMDPAMQTPGTGELVSPAAFQAGNIAPIQTATANNTTVQDPTAKAAETVDPSLITEDATVTAATGVLSDEAQVTAVTQDQLSPELKAEFDKFQQELDAIGVDPLSTMQGQYSQLMDFESGDIPQWAKGAYKVAQQQMAARGLADSTMAGEAITAALMQAALPIASQDAKVFETMSLTKLDKKSQGVFLRAGYIAQLDTQNLNNRQQAAVNNAQSFLQMDLTNLNNEQQAAVISTQLRMQKLMSNQGAENAAQQFNATSKNQMTQFYSDLGSRVSMFNAEQDNAMKTFNAQQTNAMASYNAQIQAQREEFNIKNATMIEQSNATYLRNINTQNTAAVNQANLVNSSNLLSISNTAMANEIQMWRDTEAQVFQAGENQKDRDNNRAIVVLQNDSVMQRLKSDQKFQAAGAIGSFLNTVLGASLGSIIGTAYEPSDEDMKG